MGDDPNRIRELRTAAKLSQQKLGDLVGVSKMTISDLERGDMELTLNYMKRLAPALGVQPADLLPRSLNPHALTAEERSYLDRYRMSDEDQRRMLERLAEAVTPANDKGSKAA